MANVKFSRTIAALVGAAFGFLFALVLELTGHPVWLVLPMLICAVAPSLLLAFRQIPQLEALRRKSRSLPAGSRILIIALMIGALLLAKTAFGFNPRDFGYLPLLPVVLISATLFGFGSGLLAVVLSTAAADYFFALPEYSFGLAEWQDAVGLAIFAVLGALIALAVEEFLGFGETE